MNLKGRNFLTLKDFTPEEISYLLDLAAQLKEDKKKGITGDSLKGKNIALIFEKPSTRTRCAFTIGCIDEGGHPEYLGKDDIQLGYKESVEDTVLNKLKTERLHSAIQQLSEIQRRRLMKYYFEDKC